MAEKLKFPDGFLWGASTSAHQVEGDTHNNWSAWEKENAERLAREGTMVWKQWETRDAGRFPEMLEADNYISGKAADHYNRYENDFDIAKSLGHNAHRFSIEWSRIEPKEGDFDEEAIEHYRQVIRALRERDLEPFVTLWHWTEPLWFRDIGGWEHADASMYFERYAQKVSEAFGSEVQFWITLNEPEVYATTTYLKGVWPPQKKSYFRYRKVIRQLVAAHKKAFTAIKAADADSKVCVAKHNIYFEAYKGRIVNRLLKWLGDAWWNNWFLNKIKDYQDATTVNNYHHRRINYGFHANENRRRSDLGWELYPTSIAHVARELHERYHLPVYITEHGLADADDSQRAWYITESLKELHGAITNGADVRGYLHWSLLDNFEWDKGFWPRFGLVEIDFKTQERKIRGSAQVYKQICNENALEY